MLRISTSYAVPRKIRVAVIAIVTLLVLGSFATVYFSNDFRHFSASAVSSSSAPATLSLSSNIGSPASAISVTGTGYTPSTTTTYSICFSNYAGSYCSGYSASFVSTNITGDISTSFTIPQVPAGTYYIEIVSSGSIVTQQAFSVNSINLSISPTSGQEGTAITATANNLVDGGSYEVCFSTSSTSCDGGSGWSSSPTLFTASGTGTLSATISVPVQAAQGSGTNSPYYVDVYPNGGSTMLSAAQFVITQETEMLSSNSGTVGQIITVTGTGFAKSTSGIYSICFSNYASSYCNGYSSSPVSTNSGGDISTSFQIPQVPEGLYYVEFVYPSSSVVITQAAFSVGSFNLTLSPTSGMEGTQISITASNLVVNGQYEVCFSTSSTSCSGGSGWSSNSFLFKASATGSLTASLNVPDQATQGSGTNSPYYVDVYPNGGSTVIAAAQFIITQETEKLSANSGIVGQTITVTGTGFAASTVSGTYAVCFSNYASSYCNGYSSIPVSTNGSGDMSTSFTIPQVPAGLYYVEIVYPASSIVITQQGFAISSINLAISPSSGGEGTLITATADNLVDGGSYDICFSTSSTSCSGGTGWTSTSSLYTATSSGDLTASTTVPFQATQGSGASSPYFVDIYENGQTTIIGAAQFVITAETISLSPNTGPTGTTVTVTGAGYGASTTTTYAVCFSQYSGSYCNGFGPVFVSTNASGAIAAGTTVTSPASNGNYVQIVCPCAGSDVVISQAAFSSSASPPTLSLSSNAGIVGTTITASGSGYTPSTTSTYSICFSYYSYYTCNGFLSAFVSTNGSGKLSVSFTIPQVSEGVYYVEIESGGTVVSEQGFAVSTINFVLSPNSGQEGTTITATADNLQRSGSYEVCFSTSSTSCDGGSGWSSSSTLFTASGTGTLTATIGVPVQATQGSGINNNYYVDIYLNGQSTIIAAAQFVITPENESISANSGIVGQTISVTGTGFAPSTSTTYSICFSYVSYYYCNGFGTTGVSTDSLGRISTSFTIPEVPAGLYYVQLVYPGSSTIITEQAFAVDTMNLVVSPAAGPEGTTITAKASNLIAGGNYEVCFSTSYNSCNGGSGWSSTPSLFTASGTGTLSATVSVPDQATQGSGINNNYYVDIYPNGGSTIIVATQFVITPENETVSSDSGIVGQTITVAGAGFAASTSGTYAVCFSYVSYYYCNGFGTTPVSTNGNGGISTAFEIPQVPSGLYYVQLVYPGSSIIIAEQAFAVNSFNILLSPNSGPEGTSIGVTADDLIAGGNYEVCFSTSYNSCNGGSGWSSTPSLFTASGTGTLSATVSVPDQATQGSGINNNYYVDIYPNGGSTILVAAQFVITAETLVLTPNIGGISTSLTATGNGYAPSTTGQYAVCFSQYSYYYCYNSSPTLVSTSVGGKISATLTVPSNMYGQVYVEVVYPGPNTIISETAFEVPASVILSPSSGTPGTVVTITGSDFLPSSTITIQYDGNSIATTPSTVTTNSGGEFSATITIPPGSTGSHTFSISDGTNTVDVTFTLTNIQTVTTTVTGPATTIVSNVTVISSKTVTVTSTATSTVVSSTTVTATTTTTVTSTVTCRLLLGCCTKGTPSECHIP